MAFVFALIIKICITSPATRYPVYYASGNYYEVGYQIGEQAAHRISQYIDQNPNSNKMRTYIQTDIGKTEFATLITYNQALYPNYFEELRGITDGSCLNYTDILLVQFEYELDALMFMNNYSTSNAVDSCSDIFVFNDNEMMFGHNEDDPSISLDTAYFTNITYVLEHKMLNIFGFNSIPSYLSTTPAISISHKLYLTGNYLFPSTVTPYGRATVFILRSVLESENLNDAISKVCSFGGNVSVGVSINIGYRDRLVNIENYMEQCSVLEMNAHSNDYSYHFNVYQNIQNVAQYSSMLTASQGRMNRTIQLIGEYYSGSLSEKEQILYILGDAEHPMYRTGNVSTLMTSLFDVRRNKAYFYEKCNPKKCEPSFQVDV